MKNKKKTVKSVEDARTMIKPVLRKHGIKKAGIFGSLARGETKRNSDIDILVDIESDISLLDFIGIKQEIEEVLERKVDLVEYKTIKPAIKKRILKEEVPVI